MQWDVDSGWKLKMIKRNKRVFGAMTTTYCCVGPSIKLTLAASGRASQLMSAPPLNLSECIDAFAKDAMNCANLAGTVDMFYIFSHCPTLALQVHWSTVWSMVSTM